MKSFRFIIFALALLGASSVFGQQKMVKQVNTMVDLVRQNPNDTHQTVEVLGYATPNDGGGGIFAVTNTASGVDNGTRFTSTVAGKSWERVINGPYSPNWFGADSSGAIDAAPAFSATIAAVLKSLSFEGSRRIFQKIVIPAGEYKIASTIEIINAYQLTIEGDSGGVAFVWAGATNVPAFRIVNGWQCKFENFRVRANNTFPLFAAFEQYSDVGFGPSYTHATTGTRFVNVNVEGQSGSALAIGWRIGGLVGGLLNEALGDDQNNDFTSWYNCKAGNFSKAGAILEGANNYGNLFVDCIFTGASTNTQYGVYSNNGSWRWMQGGIFLLDTCIKFDGQSGAYTVIDGMDSEQCQRLFVSDVNSGAQQNVVLKSIRFSPDKVASDGKIINYHKGGNLVIENLRAYDVNDTNSLKIEILTTYPSAANVTFTDSMIQNDDGTIFNEQQPNRIENVHVLRNGTFSILNDRHTAPSHDFLGTIDATGGLEVKPLVAKTGIGFFTGTAGATTYAYKITVTSDTGESTPGDTITIANAAATLDSNNYNTIWMLSGNSVPGARTYKIYRTLPADKQALVATLTGHTYPTFLIATDNGAIAGSVSPTSDNVPPTTNTTANAYFYGLLPNEFVRTDANTNLRSAPLALASYIQGTALETEVTGAGTLASPTTVGIPDVPRITTRLEVGGVGTSTQIGYFQGNTDGATELRHANISSGSSAVGSVMAHNGSGFIALDAFGTGHASVPGWMRLRANTNLVYEATGSTTNYHSFRIVNSEYLRLSSTGAVLTGTASVSGNITNAVLTASRVTGTDANKALVSSANVDMTEVGYIDGVTTNLTVTHTEIAAQLALKANDADVVKIAGTQTVTGNKSFSGSLVQPIDTIGALDIDWSTGNNFFKQISGNSTFTFSNPTAGQWITVKVTATGSFTSTWPTVTWRGGVTPTQTASKTDFWTFFYDGTTYYGEASQNY